MKVFALILVLSFVVTVAAQSGRALATETTATSSESTVREMFDEVNGYIRAKGAEYDAKKVLFSDRLFAQAKLEQRQMAARYAAIAGIRKDLAGEDLYYLGMLHWVAENLDGTVEALRRFIAIDDSETARRQTARSIVIIVLAKQKKLDEAETLLGEYLKTEPTKLTEKARIEGELAKAYQAQRQFTKMAPHAEAAYAASKALLKDAASRARGLDEILDAGMLVYEAYRDSGERQKAEAALDDMRSVSVATTSPSFYYYAVDQKIKFLVETGRKPAALQLYQAALKEAEKDFVTKNQQNDVLSRLKKKQKHYALLGEIAPEMPLVDQWFPGTKKTLAELRGKVVLLDFWATWCGPCFDAFPHLSEWQQELGGQGLEVLGVTRYYGTISGVVAEPLAEIEYFKRFRTREKLNYDIVVGKDQSIQLLYGATSLPTAVLIDRKGVIRYIETGTSDSRIEQMREMVYKLVAEK